jgi:hypothetical protein
MYVGLWGAAVVATSDKKINKKQKDPGFAPQPKQSLEKNYIV